MTVNGAWMGKETAPAERAGIRIDAWAPGRIAHVELLKNARPLRRFAAGQHECHITMEDRTGGPAFYHCRVTLDNGHLAVCSPVWVG